MKSILEGNEKVLMRSLRGWGSERVAIIYTTARYKYK
jgi:hypothetical protein